MLDDGDPRTVNRMLERAAHLSHAGIRLLDRNEKATWKPWSEIRERALRVGAGLRRLGIREGERVALVFPTSWEFFDAFFGTLLAGAVPVPLYPPVRLGRLGEYHRRTARMLERVGAAVVLADRRLRRLLGETIHRARPPHGCRLPSALPPGELVPATVSPDDLALVQFSSGTTMDPKPVALTHRAVMAQTVLLNRLWPDRPGLRHSGVSWLPLYHDMGLIGCIFPALERPGPLTLLPPEAFAARPALWLRVISRYRATLSSAPNFAYGLCVKKIRDQELDGVDLSCWRLAVNGAEVVVPEVLRAFQQRFAPWGLRREALTPVYGLSEAALAVTFSDRHRPFTSRRFDRGELAAGRVREAPEGVELVSAGRPLPGFKVRIADPGGRRLGPDEVGQILVKGPSLMTGYLDQPERTAEVLGRGGWLVTGDLGLISADQLYLVGRIKDLLILRGRNHAPEEVERAVDAVEGVRTGCAVAVSWLPEEADGEVLLVLVEVRREIPPAEGPAIAERCARAVLAATGLIPERVVPLLPGSLPRTSSGKLRRREALRQYLAGELAAPAPVSPRQLAGAMARSAAAWARWSWERR